MELKEIRAKGSAELNRLKAELREELRDLRFKVTQRQLKDVRRLREVKREIARVETVLTEKGTPTP
jgi:large subunit ribosomal protein L29